MHRRLRPVTGFDKDLAALVADMVATMQAADGVGLAANQIGVQKRLFVYDVGDGPGAIVNPVLSGHRGEWEYTEGCLSVPDQYGEVMRPATIGARWLDETGATREEDISGLIAVCLQHEIDHLDGVLFIVHLSRLKREILLKKLAKMRKERGAKAA